MTDILYEFPLNEKIRTYLRIENLLARLTHQLGDTTPWASLDFLSALFAILDIIERGDLKSDLLKDLEKHEKQLVAWSQHPSINNSALQDLLQTIVQLSGKLTTTNKLGQKLRDDKFLASLKQRFSIPGGSCCFDLPHLHQWQHQDSDIIVADQQRWLSELEILKTIIELDLKMIRERGQFHSYSAENGLYTDTVENVELLQIKVPSDSAYYPTVSGHKHRFSIRFMENNQEQVKSACLQSVRFLLSAC
ncbi:cell division protein ZapD [Catenovulum sp. 2E275]|uniref:cell division protein ZapD n=1 Tax=Catenovulum sp. 2E275 TaxID=2980497 RepID=UPI0021D20F64|nr:cell division protein ZapD [Catenovulum sp. 2E275]MCU4674353.1 cell division protein ZapD [Catenovulum sp. 2E275]